MKLILTSALVALLGSAASAEVTAEIFRPAGCNPEFLRPVMSELNPGEILYWHNTEGQGCKADRGDTGAAGKVKPVVSPDPDEEDPGEECKGGCGEEVASK